MFWWEFRPSDQSIFTSFAPVQLRSFPRYIPTQRSSLKLFHYSKIHISACAFSISRFLCFILYTCLVLTTSILFLTDFFDLIFHSFVRFTKRNRWIIVPTMTEPPYFLESRATWDGNHNLPSIQQSKSCCALYQPFQISKGRRKR